MKMRLFGINDSLEGIKKRPAAALGQPPACQTGQNLDFDRARQCKLEASFRSVMNFLSLRRQNSACARTTADCGSNKGTFAAACYRADSSTEARTAADNGCVALLCCGSDCRVR